MIKIDGYAIDAALSEDHELEAEVTEFPVEEGANVTDHVRIKPREVTIKGCVSNTPIDDKIKDLREASNLEPSEEALVVLTSIFEARDPVTIETSIKVYENMVLESLSIPQTGDTGEALQFTAKFREVVIEKNQRVIIRAVPIGQKKQRLGAKNGKPPGWIGTDSRGRDIIANELAPGVEPKYTRADGTNVPVDEARDAAKKNDAVLVKYDKSGHAIPVDQRDYQPYTPQQKKPYWTPQLQKK